ncbi:MAG TPA: hypothetical protein VK963_03255 [Candidatus Saccharimonadales bacterium]|nr:hypothetical protein [Candidatus Saccharimonadales bacterium]
MARNFLDEDTKAPRAPGYMDGFRFGFGQFVAWLVGLTLLAGLALVVSAILRTR